MEICLAGGSTEGVMDGNVVESNVEDTMGDAVEDGMLESDMEDTVGDAANMDAIKNEIGVPTVYSRVRSATERIIGKRRIGAWPSDR